MCKVQTHLIGIKTLPSIDRDEGYRIHLWTNDTLLYKHRISHTITT